MVCAKCPSFGSGGVGRDGLAGSAQAQVFQSDAAMTPLPQPVGMSEWNLVTSSWSFNRMVQVNHDPMGTEVSNQNKHYGDYFPTFVDGDAITLQGLFKFRGEMLDPVKDAKTAPATSRRAAASRPAAAARRRLRSVVRLVQRRRSEQHDSTDRRRNLPFHSARGLDHFRGLAV